MKVASVCPACGRPASSKGRSVCLYCGAPLTPVETGKVTAAGTGQPIEVPRPHLKVSPAPPVPAGPRPGWIDAPDDRSLAQRVLAKGWVRLALVVGLILLAIFGLGRLIDDHRPPGYSDSGTWR